MPSNIRCFSCGKVLGNKRRTYWKRVHAGEKPFDVLESLLLWNDCCRADLLTSIDHEHHILVSEEIERKHKRAQWTQH